MAALALLLNWLDRRQGRAESYRAALYSFELQRLGDLMMALARVRDRARRVISADEDTADAERGELDEAVRDASLSRDAGVGIIRAMALKAVTDFLTAIAMVIPASGTLLVVAEGLGEVEDAWYGLVGAIRSELGVDSLGDQIRDLTGVADRERQERTGRQT